MGTQYNTYKNATNFNIYISRGSAATFLGVVGNVT